MNRLQVEVSITETTAFSMELQICREIRGGAGVKCGGLQGPVHLLSMCEDQAKILRSHSR